MPDASARAAAASWEPDWARRLYRWFALVYDPFRALWSHWTRSAERELDALFRERIGRETDVLELAPGTGINLVRLFRCAPSFRSYLGVDVSEQMLVRARRRARGDARVTLELGDATDLSGIERRFDFVVCTWLLSHLDRPAETIRAALEKLATGGTAAFVFLGAPRPLLLRFILRCVMRAFRVRFVDPEPIRRLPHLERFAMHSRGMAALAVFRKPAAGAGDPQG